MWPFKKKETEKEKYQPPYRISQSIDGNWRIQRLTPKFIGSFTGVVYTYETILGGFLSPEEAQDRLNEWLGSNPVYLNYQGVRVS